VPPRPPVVLAFGQFLTTCREAVGLEPSEVARLVTEQFGLPLSKSALWRYEAGQTAAPDPAILLCLSRIYGVSLERILVVLTNERASTPAERRPDDRAEGISAAAIDLAKRFDALVDPQHRELVEAAVRLLVESEAKRSGRA
jgi:transcriptional regulator with XRE-family HTH domain